MSKPPSAHERFKKTMMFDGQTRDKVLELHKHFDIDQTEVYIRAINIMHALMAESRNGKSLVVKKSNAEKALLELNFEDNFDDEKKLSMKFNQMTLNKIDDLSNLLNIYATYVLRRAVALFYFIFTEIQKGNTLQIVDQKSGEAETIRFF